MIHGEMMHSHSREDIAGATTNSVTVGATLSIDVNKEEITVASTYAGNTEQASVTISLSGDPGKSCLLMMGKMAAAGVVTLPAGAEIVSGAWSTLYRNVAEVYCYAAGKYMVSITQKTAA